MGLEQVHSMLMDVFPQIDTRILRTIAIENSKDVDAACLAVLTDIIPFTTLRSTPGSPLSQSLYESQSSEFEGSVELDEDDQTINLVPEKDVDPLFYSVNLKAVEEMITDVEDNKKTMFSETDSVMRLMNEVEVKEQDAEQAKINNKGVDYIMVDLEVLKQSLLEFKKSNNMRAGEVYPEKAMLATELEELQSRVVSLANERDALFSDLKEMRRTLETRLAAAENVIISAEQERFEKKKVTFKAALELESMKRKVAKESKILKQQAEENAKLREFLMDRGRVVDILQREIAGICNNVKLLKESFDDNTSCILASSSKTDEPEDNVSLATPGGAQPLVMTDEPEDDACFAQQLEWKSTAEYYGEEPVDDGWVSEPEKDVISCFDQQSSTGDYRKELVEDGWELCGDSD